MDNQEDKAWAANHRITIARQKVVDLVEQHNALQQEFVDWGGYTRYVLLVVAFGLCAFTAWYGFKTTQPVLLIQFFFVFVFLVRCCNRAEELFMNREYMRECKANLTEARKKRQEAVLMGFQDLVTATHADTAEDVSTREYQELIATLRRTLLTDAWLKR